MIFDSGLAGIDSLDFENIYLETLKNIRIKSGKNPVMGTAEIMRSIPTLEVEYDRR